MSTPVKAIVVTAANADYFVLLRDLVLSLQQTGVQERFSIGVLDLGLAQDHLDWLKAQGIAKIVKPEWPFKGLENQPEWYKAMVCRPFLPNYFPEWDVIVWSDSDAWAQTAEAFDLALAGVRREGFAVIPLIDRGYWTNGVTQGAAHTASWQEESIAEGFGEQLARELRHYPLIIGSFLAGHRLAPHWNVWAQLLANGLQRKVYFSVEQASLSVMVHRSGLNTHLLPNTSHWACHIGALGLDMPSRQYVEPYAPYRPVSMLALAATAKREPVLVKTVDGRTLSRSVRYRMQHQRYRVNVTMGGKPIPVDGIATSGFRERLYDAISRDATVRFVQIGAMDGKAFDPLHRAINQHSWQGLFVEPMPDMMAKLKAAYAHRPQIHYAEVAVAETSGKRVMHRVRAEAVDSGRAPPWAAGLSSLTPERTALSGRAISQAQYDAFRNEVEQVEVVCLTFADLASQHPAADIDVLQIDTEGYDYRILSQIDLLTYRPQTVQIEVINLPTEEVSLAMEQLWAAGYLCYLMDDNQDLLAVRLDVLVRLGLET